MFRLRFFLCCTIDRKLVESYLSELSKYSDLYRFFEYQYDHLLEHATSARWSRIAQLLARIATSPPFYVRVWAIWVPSTILWVLTIFDKAGYAVTCFWFACKVACLVAVLVLRVRDRKSASVTKRLNLLVATTCSLVGVMVYIITTETPYRNRWVASREFNTGLFVVAVSTSACTICVRWGYLVLVIPALTRRVRGRFGR